MGCLVRDTVQLVAVETRNIVETQSFLTPKDRWQRDVRGSTWHQIMVLPAIVYLNIPMIYEWFMVICHIKMLMDFGC